jgi:hypothetical protein
MLPRPAKMARTVKAIIGCITETWNRTEKIAHNGDKDANYLTPLRMRACPSDDHIDHRFTFEGHNSPVAKSSDICAASVKGNLAGICILLALFQPLIRSTLTRVELDGG